MKHRITAWVLSLCLFLCIVPAAYAAEYIAKAVNGQLFEIDTVKPYAQNYRACCVEAVAEAKANARPEIKGYVDTIDCFDTIFVCFPCWCGTAPMCVFTFLEHYDWSGIKIVPVCTNEGSGLANSEKDIAASCPGAVMAPGLSVKGHQCKDSEEMLQKADIRLICSPYANSNVDVPALPQEMYAVTEDKARYAVLDVGGDDRGALALGRYAPEILKENDFHMIYVFNASRPLSRRAEDALEIMKEIEMAGGVPFTAIVNNTNLGKETTWETVTASMEEANKLSQISGLPLLFTSVNESVLPITERENEQYFPLKLQKTIW